MVRHPTHSLVGFQAAMAGGFRATKVAMDDAFVLGFSVAGIKAALSEIRPEMFYKTMPSKQRPGQWQDVYHVPSPVGLLYVKFTNEGLQEWRLLSFKKK